MKGNIIKVAGLMVAVFLVVICYQTYLQVYRSSFLLNHPNNRRLQFLEENVARGRILDSSGRVLAQTVESGNTKHRIYPLGKITSNITGYVSRKYGRWGVESSYNEALLGLGSSVTGDDFWAMKKVTANKRGNDVVLSIDANLQQVAYRMLGDRKGAVVAIEPSTGRILAMVSKPGFNPENIEEDWGRLTANPDSPLLNRASQGLYPPGSIMKVITAAGILDMKPQTVNRTFDAPGFVTIEGRRIEDKQAQGRLSFAQAFAKSSNYVFATLGIEQGAKKFIEMAHAFGIGQKIPLDLPVQQSSIPSSGSLSKLELGESAIGQGRVMVTPLNMALVAAAVANKGVVMAPRVVDQVRNPDGSILSTFKPKVLWTAIKESVAETLKNVMVSTVESGTGRAAAVSGVQVAGKTGSAQNPHGQTHAWFIGFAPAEKPQVAIAVIVENGGAGGAEAAPIAREIIRTVIGQKR